MRLWLGILGLVVAIVLSTSLVVYPPPTRIVFDISWPNCATTTVSPRGEPGIVGINGGLAFRPNPCLAKEAGEFKQLDVYLNTGYPGGQRALAFKNAPKHCLTGDNQCLAYNYGFTAAKYDIKYAALRGVVAKYWWLDVETENSWSDSTLVNRAALGGMLDALAPYAGKANLGFYSYPGQWDLLTGKWRNGYPAWAATGTATLSAAQKACQTPSFTGGPVVLGQFATALDTNWLCAN